MLVIAVGNAYRSDDGVGLELAAAVRALGLPQLTVVEALGDVAIIDAWAEHDAVILLDAVQSGAAPGTVIRRDVVEEPLPREWFHLSSHQIGIADAVEIARAMGTLPARVVFIGIEGEHFETGVGLSPAVASSIDRAAALVREEARPGRARRHAARLVSHARPRRASAHLPE